MNATLVMSLFIRLSFFLSLLLSDQVEELEKRVQQLDARVKELEAENKVLHQKQAAVAVAGTILASPSADTFSPHPCSSSNQAEANWIKQEKD